MAATSSTVVLERLGAVAHVRLDRPDVANAIDLDTSRELERLVEEIAGDDDLKAVLLSGAGPRFCSGGDVGWMVQAEDQPAALEALAGSLDAALQRLGSIPKPVVVAVHGAVAGAGLSVMLTGDLVVAERRTKLVFAYPAVGLTPDVGLSWLLPRAVGQQRALELALTGRALDADTAREWGMVTEVVDGDPLERALELATAIADGPAWALGQARRLLRTHQDVDRAAAGAEETRTIVEAVQTPDAQRTLLRFAPRDTKGA